MLPYFSSLSVSCCALCIIYSRCKAPCSTLHFWKAMGGLLGVRDHLPCRGCGSLFYDPLRMLLVCFWQNLEWRCTSTECSVFENDQSFHFLNFDRSSLQRRRSDADERIMHVVTDWPTRILHHSQMITCVLCVSSLCLYTFLYTDVDLTACITINVHRSK